MAKNTPSRAPTSWGVGGLNGGGGGGDGDEPVVPFLEGRKGVMEEESLLDAGAAGGEELTPPRMHTVKVGRELGIARE
jgi:hypothetical protein